MLELIIPLSLIIGPLWLYLLNIELVSMYLSINTPSNKPVYTLSFLAVYEEGKLENAPLRYGSYLRHTSELL